MWTHTCMPHTCVLAPPARLVYCAPCSPLQAPGGRGRDGEDLQAEAEGLGEGSGRDQRQQGWRAMLASFSGCTSSVCCHLCAVPRPLSSLS